MDELDRHLRTNLDPKVIASNHAPQLVIGGAIFGILAGIGTPKILRRLITWGVPAAIVAVTIKNALEKEDVELEGLS